MDATPLKAATIRELLEHDAFLRTLARSLVIDEGRADDVVQEAYVAVLNRPPPRPGPLTGWLAAIVRHLAWKSRRGEARRDHHEQSVAAPDPVPSAATVLAREEARRRIVEAVLALEEPYRSTVLLRHFEQMPPRAIAKHFGVPVETVRTRLKRGLERLRLDLDREYGGERGAWCVALLPFARAAPGGALAAAGGSIGGVMTALSAGVLVMSVKAKVASVAAVVASAALAWVFLRSHDAPSEATHRAAASEATSPPAAPPADEAASASTRTSDPNDAATRRADVRAPAPDSSAHLASIHVKVTWEKDKTPAAHVGVVGIAAGRRDYYVFTLFALTDSAGECWLHDVEPGLVLVVPELASYGNCARVAALAGKTMEVSVTIPTGVDVEGVVVDEQKRPVDHADIWVGPDGTNSCGGRVMTTSDENGRFSLRSICGYRFVAARAAGYAPSLFRTVGGQKDATQHFELVLRAGGGSLAGRVVDADGKAVAHARVVFGDQGATVYPPPEVGGMPFSQLVETVSEDDGSFEISGTMTGTLPLQVRARGFAPFKKLVTVNSDEAADVEVKLDLGAVVEGKVTDAGGTGLKGAEVSIGHPGSFTATSTNSAADGTYRIDRAMPGDVEITAEMDGHGSTKATLHASSGETTRWDPILSNGLELKGRIVDEDDHALAGFHVLAEGPDPASSRGFFSQFADSGPDGRFSMPGCPAGDLHVRVMFPKEGQSDAAEVEHVKAGGADLVIRVQRARLCSIWIEGVVADAEGRPPADVNVSIVSEGAKMVPIDYPDHATGHFKLGPFPPGKFHIIVRAQDYPQTEFLIGSIAADETRDVGTLQLQHGGALRAKVTVAGAGKVEGFQASCTSTENGCWSNVSFDGTTATTSELAPGKYRLRVEANACAPAIELFTIQPGVPTNLDVTLLPAVRVTLRAPLTADWKLRAAASGAAPLASVTDARGETLATVGWSSASERFEWTLGLAPGNYSFALLDHDSVLASASFEITEPQRPAVALDLTLR